MMLLQITTPVIFFITTLSLMPGGHFLKSSGEQLHERFYTLQLPAKQVAAFIYLFFLSNQAEGEKKKKKNTYDKDDDERGLSMKYCQKVLKIKQLEHTCKAINVLLICFPPYLFQFLQWQSVSVTLHPCRTPLNLCCGRLLAPSLQ